MKRQKTCANVMILSAIVHDDLGRNRPNPRKRLKLPGCRRVDVDLKDPAEICGDSLAVSEGAVGMITCQGEVTVDPVEGCPRDDNLASTWRAAAFP